MSQAAIAIERKTANAAFKKSYGSLFWLGVVVAIIFHYAIIKYGPTYVLTKGKDRVVKVMETEDIVEIKIEVAQPPSVAAPAMPVPTDNTEISLDATIEDTDFNPYAPPPPPPPTSSSIEDAPVFVAYEDAPKPIETPQPKYPPLAQEAGIEGKVILNVFIDKGGNVKNAIVIKGVPNTGLDEAAIEAIKKWKYEPALQRGQPVGVWVSQIVKFELEN
jgi:protein TonB